MVRDTQFRFKLFGIIILGLLLVGMQGFAGDALAQPAADGDGSLTGTSEAPTDGNLEFTPVTPCRIADSRVPWATGIHVGPFPNGAVICYDNYGGGAGEIAPQGGNLAGCPSVVGEPAAAHINVTAVPVIGQGNLRIFPADVAVPNASVVNWRAGVQNIANAVSVDSFFDIGPLGSDEICIALGGPAGGWTHIVMDVMGYFDVPGAAPPTQ